MRASIVLCLVVPFVAVGCGGAQQAGNSGASDYPVVTDPPPTYGEPMTEPSGAVVLRPVKPSEHETDPSPSCERQPFKSPYGGGLVVVPPRPGLTAKALAERTIRLSWQFEAVPEDCRPSSMRISIVANDARGATPTTESVPYTGRTGAATLTYPDFLPPPDVALASATMANGRSSRTAKVLISP
jgi:hypothetical protein